MKVFKTIFALLISLLVISFFNMNEIHADTGPKPRIEITIEGDTHGMYLTLLSKERNNGPWTPERIKEPANEIEEIFLSYNDKDNFYFVCYYQNIESGKFVWSYYPPQTFKVLLYDSINDKLIIDDNIYETYAFNSEFKLVINNQSITFTKNKTISSELFNFFLRLIICLVIEIGLALIFKFKKQELLIITLANLITQVALNVILNLTIYYNGFHIFSILPMYILAEVLILVIEMVSYIIFIPRIDEKYNLKTHENYNIVLYSISANLLSLVIGFIILAFVPGMR